MLKLSDKNKLTKMFIAVKNNKNNTLITDNANKQTNTTIKKYVISNDSFLKQNQESSYQKLKSHTYDVLDDNAWTGSQYTTWEVSMSGIPEKLIPFLNVNFITDCSADVVPVFSYFYTGSGTTMTLNAGLYYEGNSSLVNRGLVKAKLMLSWDLIPLIIKTSSVHMTVRDMIEECEEYNTPIEHQPIAYFNIDGDLNYLDLNLKMFYGYSMFPIVKPEEDWLNYNYENVIFDRNKNYKKINEEGVEVNVDFAPPLNYSVFNYVNPILPIIIPIVPVMPVIW